MPPRSIKSLRETMPIIYSNEGVWEGWYRYFDIDGNKIDEHRVNRQFSCTNHADDAISDSKGANV